MRILDRPAPTVLDASSVTRTEVVRPAMCGHNSLFAGQIGDWTWDAVSELCDVDVLRARTPAGDPTYLSFYYYRIRGGRTFHLRTPSFGDTLRITTRLYDFGSESVLALHRIDRGDAHPDTTPAPVDADTFHRAGGDSLRVENLNRWISRGGGTSNETLVRASPVGFRHRHLPTLPAHYSPRVACGTARTALTFHPDSHADGTRYADTGPPRRLYYPVDPSRDLNGVGLLYFASYFSIVDRALLDLYRGLGRDDAAFLDRVVVDQQLCYLGNADADCVIAIDVRHRVNLDEPGREMVDVVLRDSRTDRLLAVCTLHLLTTPTDGRHP
jgi:probable biosynthetic protein (TIGR04098 family)